MKKPSLMAVLALAVPAVAVALLSTWPRYRFKNSDMSALVVSFKHSSKRVHECTEEERGAFLSHLRNPRYGENVAVQCGSRERLPVALRVALDGVVVARGEILPSGWRRDSAVYVMEKVVVAPGAHRVEVTVREGGEHGRYYDAEVGFPDGKIVRMDFDGERFFIRE